MPKPVRSFESRLERRSARHYTRTMIHIADTAELEDLLRLNQVVHAWHVDAYPELFRSDCDDEFRDYFAASLADPDVCHFVAYHEDGAVGFTQVALKRIPPNPFRRSMRLLHIAVIVVDTPWQHRGVGRLLVERVRQFAVELGIERIELDHWEGNPAARFFEAVGFQPFRHYLFTSQGDATSQGESDVFPPFRSDEAI